jgi:Zn-dependent M28 family amino/carboxypeptidase
VPLRAVAIRPESSVLLHAGDDTLVFRSGPDFVVNTGGAGAFRDFRGRAIFFGQPAHARELVAAERSMVGRVAVFAGPLGAAATEIVPRLGMAGAAGIILLVPDSAQFDLFVRSRGDTRFHVDADVRDPVWQPPLPVLLAGPALTDALLDGVPLPAGLMEGAAAAAVDLDRTVTARIATTSHPLPATNVAAMLPGSDPARADEYVVYTAHFDHLGVGVPDAQGDSIYSGFSDNAAGVAMLLAIAESLRHEPPARSVLFLFLTAEEVGLLGSSYLAVTFPVPLERIRALINLDGGAPPAPPISWRIAGGDSPLGETATAIAADRGWTTITGPASPNSDHWPFLARGVPSIFIIPGDEWENVDAAGRSVLRERWNRYHQPGDRWSPDFPFAGLARYAEFALLIGRHIGDRQ